MELKNTFYHGDCLFVLNHDVTPESVDLIYLDPPFFTGKTQTGKWKGEWHPEAMEVSFEDSKRFWKEKGISELAPEWMKHIAIKRPDFASYLYYMMERLQACHKV
jgi:DNA modification methylase